jgi:peptidoglycan-associated lipoprotein
MNHVSKKLLLVLAGAALFVAGCTKKPTRPSPDQTVLGGTPGGGSGSLTPTDVATNPDANGLGGRDGAMDPSKMGQGIVQPVFFEFNQFDIKASERPKLQEAAKYLKDHAGAHLLLEGHCDWRGTDEYNLALGDRRANAAKKYLISLGVPATQLETLSKGSLDAVKNADEATAKHDRRVEVFAQQK